MTHRERSLMPPCRITKSYRPPTDLEREFLRIVTFGNPELERQVESFEIADYDVTGWCDVNVFDGPPSPNPIIDGPAIDLTQAGHLTVSIAAPDFPGTSFLVSGGKIRKIAPVVHMGAPDVYRVEIILWSTHDGMLYAVEVISYGDGFVVNPYRLFVEAAKSEPNLLQYPTPARDIHKNR